MEDGFRFPPICYKQGTSGFLSRAAYPAPNLVVTSLHHRMGASSLMKLGMPKAHDRFKWVIICNDGNIYETILTKSKEIIRMIVPHLIVRYFMQQP